MGGVDGGDRQHTEGAKANGADQGGEAGDGVRVGHGDGGDRPINTGMGDKFTLTDFFLAVLIHVPNFEGAINVEDTHLSSMEAVAIAPIPHPN